MWLAPESPRFLSVTKQKERLQSLLYSMAGLNGVQLPEGRLVLDGEPREWDLQEGQQQQPQQKCDPTVVFNNAPGSTAKKPANASVQKALSNGGGSVSGSEKTDGGDENKKAGYRQLIAPEILELTLIQWFIWFTTALGYYASVLLTTEVRLEVCTE